MAELFFDLVFVFAVTQLSHTLLAHLTWREALQVGLLLGGSVDGLDLHRLVHELRRPREFSLPAITGCSSATS
jgi:hypothetical protein